jgi:hypothetical protein
VADRSVSTDRFWRLIDGDNGAIDIVCENGDGKEKWCVFRINEDGTYSRYSGIKKDELAPRLELDGDGAIVEGEVL